MEKKNRIISHSSLGYYLKSQQLKHKMKGKKEKKKHEGKEDQNLSLQERWSVSPCLKSHSKVCSKYGIQIYKLGLGLWRNFHSSA